jgi:nucleotide-binding universal stress UspA family protein
MSEKAVLVGVDGSLGGERALGWAAAEAARMRAPLTVCFAVSPAAVGIPVLAGHHGADVLAAATDRLAVEWPQLEVRAVLGEGYPSIELLRRSAGHQLVAVGSRGDSGLAGILLGTVAGHLVAHAHCPVVVVPPRSTDPAAPVVVGVDGSELNRPAVEFAFAAADRHDIPLVALSSVDARQSGTGFGAGQTMAEQLVELARQAVVPWAEKYPQVPVEHRIVAGPPVPELVAASTAASLTVVGSRGHGAMTALLLGSVSRRVAQQAQSPVAVVRDLDHRP